MKYFNYHEKDAMTLKEMNRLKNNCSGGSSIYAFLMVHCFSTWPCLNSIPTISETMVFRTMLPTHA